MDYWRRPESDSPDEWVNGGAFDPAGLGPMSAEDVERSLFEWGRFRREMLPFIQSFPLVLSPAAEKPAVRHGEDAGRIPYTLTWSLVGYPAVVVRAGSTAGGLPVGCRSPPRPGGRTWRWQRQRWWSAHWKADKLIRARGSPLGGTLLLGSRGYA